jgi:hypothetical protein
VIKIASLLLLRSATRANDPEFRKAIRVMNWSIRSVIRAGRAGGSSTILFLKSFTQLASIGPAFAILAGLRQGRATGSPL